jgi:hypothetical protein
VPQNGAPISRTCRHNSESVQTGRPAGRRRPRRAARASSPAA